MPPVSEPSPESAEVYTFSAMEPRFILCEADCVSKRSHSRRKSSSMASHYEAS